MFVTPLSFINVSSIVNMYTYYKWSVYPKVFFLKKIMRVRGCDVYRKSNVLTLPTFKTSIVESFGRFDVRYNRAYRFSSNDPCVSTVETSHPVRYTLDRQSARTNGPSLLVRTVERVIMYTCTGVFALFDKKILRND